MSEIFFIINKQGLNVELDFNKILLRLNKLKDINPKLNVNIPAIAQHTIKMMVNGISTRQLDDISAKYCAANITKHIDYGTMASRIEVDNIHRETKSDYLEAVIDIDNYYINNEKIDLLDSKLINFVKKYSEKINLVINYDLDYKYTYFGFKTLQKSYLLKHIDNILKTDKIKERPQQMLMRVSIGIHFDKIDTDGSTSLKTLEDIFETYNLMSKKYYTHATPTLFNSGTKRQSLSSCFLLAVDDSLESIYKTLTDTTRISKWSGGIGIHVSQVRAKGSVIKSTNGRSEGIVPMLKVYNDSAIFVSQGGGKRKGSTAVYLEMWHADIESFLDLKKPIGDEMLRARDLFLALWICDLFMKRLKKAITTNTDVLWSLFCPSRAKGLSDTYGDEYEKLYLQYENEKIYNKQISITELWKHVLELQMESGVPYISFKDHVNRKNNQNNLGTIKSSNLCVSGDTLVLTDTGYHQIKDLSGKNVNIWDTKKFIEAPVFKTGDNQKLLKFETSDGCEIKTTEYHKFVVIKGDTRLNITYGTKRAHELQVGDKLFKCTYPIIDGNEKDILYPYTHGFYCGDGTDQNYKNHKIYENDRRYAHIDLYHEKQELDSFLTYTSKLLKQEKQNKTRYTLPNDIDEKFKTPNNCSIKCKLLWLSGLFDADGCLIICSKKTNTMCIQIASIHKEFLYKIKLLCNTLGCNPNIATMYKKRKVLLPSHNENNDYKLYNCKEAYRMSFSAYDTYTLYNLGLDTHRLKYNYIKPLFNSKRFSIITSIKEVSELHTTYCLKSKDTEMAVFNGLVTKNCNEINIYTDKDNIGVCNLASLCLSKFVEKDLNGVAFYNFEKLHYVSKIATKNLNKVIDNNIYPVKEGRDSDSKNRPIGLGIQSLAKVFFKFKISFTSEKARNLNKLIFETIHHAALEASCELAKEYGTYNTYSTSMMATKGLLQPDLWNVKPSNLWNWEILRNDIKKYGVRNSLLIALMPTASTAQIMGNTESFEPITSNMYIRSTLSGTFQVINKYLIKDLINLNLWNDEMKQIIIANNGSIQNINSIPLQIKEIYMTTWELKQKDIIQMEADRNAYVCQSTSSNRYMKSPTFSKLTSMHMYSWELGLKTGMYYLRSQAATDAIKFNVDTNILKQQKQDEEECVMCSA